MENDHVTMGIPGVELYTEGFQVYVRLKAGPVDSPIFFKKYYLPQLFFIHTISLSQNTFPIIKKTCFPTKYSILLSTTMFFLPI